MTALWIKNHSSFIRGEVVDESPRGNIQVEPKFGDYQLIGDSLLVRFADKILHVTNRCINGARTIGHCVSGQRIDQLRRKIKAKAYPLASNIMVLIGTNDVLCGGDVRAMVRHFNRLMKLLRNCDKILILTLPPIPKLSVSFYHWTLIRQYNTYLKSLHNGKSVLVADICPIFTKCQVALEYEVPLNPAPKKRKRKPERRSEVRGRNESNSESDYKTTTETNGSSRESVLCSSDGSPLGGVHQGSKHLSVKLRKVEIVTASETFCTPEPSPTRSAPRRARVSPDDTPRRKIEAPGRLFLRSIKELSAQKVGLGTRTAVRKVTVRITATDHWTVDSDDSISNHVYMSQDETKYERSSEDEEKAGAWKAYGKRVSDFAKYIDSMNNSGHGSGDEGKRESGAPRGESRNEKEDEMSESSATSEENVRKHQILPYVDRQFVNMLRSHITILGANRSFDGARAAGSPNFRSPPPSISNLPPLAECLNLPPPPPPPMPTSPSSPSPGRRLLNLDGLSERDKSIVELSGEICHLEFYEVFFSFSHRLDMIHLNYRGLNCLKQFLISQGYITNGI